MHYKHTDWKLHASTAEAATAGFAIDAVTWPADCQARFCVRLCVRVYLSLCVCVLFLLCSTYCAAVALPVLALQPRHNQHRVVCAL
jgi:hypothetical protein